MCFKKLKNRIEQNIKKEKNIQIRERIEHDLKRKGDVILAVLLGGNLLAGAKSIISSVTLIVTSFLLLLFYGFYENWIIANYKKYTNKLIRKKSK